MAAIKLTKNELRSQQYRLTQLQKYLPTLQLKKAMLQVEVNEARQEIAVCEKRYQETHQNILQFSRLLTDFQAVDPKKIATVKEIKKRYENIAGVEVPYFDSMTFVDYDYDLFGTPMWLDSAVSAVRSLSEASTRIKVAKEKKEALEHELRQVSIRVNLFEKILIPRASENIKKIKVFLGDQELAAVCRAKVAKGKIQAAKAEKRLSSTTEKELSYAS